MPWLSSHYVLRFCWACYTTPDWYTWQTITVTSHSVSNHPGFSTDCSQDYRVQRLRSQWTVLLVRCARHRLWFLRTKGPLVWKAFPCHDVIIIYWINPWHLSIHCATEYLVTSASGSTFDQWLDCAVPSRHLNHCSTVSSNKPLNIYQIKNSQISIQRKPFKKYLRKKIGHFA